MTAPRVVTDWRTLVVSGRTGIENMARDTGLMERARVSGESVFTVYDWARPTLSFGRNQEARARYDLASIGRRGVDVVRRPTGGRALLHHREVTYSVTAPIEPSESLAESYHRINRVLIAGLRKLGVVAIESQSAAASAPPGTLPCFATPANGELVTAGGKLVGSAQVREAGALLQHGSILLEDDQAMIADLMVDQPSEVVPPAATLTAAMGRTPSISEVSEALFAALAEVESTTPVSLDEADTTSFTAPHVAHYESELWTWRR
jgi:lipoate-protein ligase A